jgi:cytochrome b561
MPVRDTSEGYGTISRLFHWLMAAAILGMFGLGLWMAELDYYSPYYNSAPSVHKSVGIILMLLLALRFGWRLASVRPSDGDLKPWERTAARAVHWGFYPLLLALMISGYLISTADGRPIEVFGWFSVPSPGENKGLEDTAGAVHAYLAYATIALAALHASAAIKHHVIDRGRALQRMWSGPRTP